MAASGDSKGPEDDAPQERVVIPFRKNSNVGPGAEKTAGGPRAPEQDRIEVHPEDILQPDRRPWARLSLEQVVVRAILFSALVVVGFLALVAGLGRAVGAW